MCGNEQIAKNRTALLNILLEVRDNSKYFDITRLHHVTCEEESTCYTPSCALGWFATTQAGRDSGYNFTRGEGFAWDSKDFISMKAAEDFGTKPRDAHYVFGFISLHNRLNQTVDETLWSLICAFSNSPLG